MKRINLLGHVYGRLTVVAQIGTAWVCDCACGAKGKVVRTTLLRSGTTKSCGCLRREMGVTLGASSRKHGEGNKGKTTAEYRTWSGMISRCHNANHPLFPDYGGRGISVCAAWRADYRAFLADMGRRTSEFHSLDRINNDGNYEPDNCRWATWEQQNNNQRPKSKYTEFGLLDSVTHEGRTQTVGAWIADVGMTVPGYRSRKKRGMTTDEALFTPRMKPGKKPKGSV